MKQDVIERVQRELQNINPNLNVLSHGCLYLIRNNEIDLAYKCADKLSEKGSGGYFGSAGNPAYSGAFAVRALVESFEKSGDIKYKTIALKTSRNILTFYFLISLNSFRMKVKKGKTYLPNSLNMMAYGAMALRYRRKLKPRFSFIASFMEKRLTKKIINLQNANGSFPDGGTYENSSNYPDRDDYKDNTVRHPVLEEFVDNNFRVGTADQYQAMIICSLRGSPNISKINMKKAADYLGSRYGTVPIGKQFGWAYSVLGKEELNKEPGSHVSWLYNLD